VDICEKKGLNILQFREVIFYWQPFQQRAKFLAIILSFLCRSPLDAVYELTFEVVENQNLKNIKV